MTFMDKNYIYFFTFYNALTKMLTPQTEIARVNMASSSSLHQIVSLKAVP